MSSAGFSLRKALTTNTAVYSSMCQDSQPNTEPCKLSTVHRRAIRRYSLLSPLRALNNVMQLLSLDQAVSQYVDRPGLGPQRISIVSVVYMQLYGEASIGFCYMLNAALHIAILAARVQPCLLGRAIRVQQWCLVH